VLAQNQEVEEESGRWTSWLQNRKKIFTLALKISGNRAIKLIKNSFTSIQSARYIKSWPKTHQGLRDLGKRFASPPTIKPWELAMTRTAEHISSPQTRALEAHQRLSCATPNSYIELAFLHNDPCESHLDTLAQVIETKAHLAYTIARRPKDLRLHVERIRLHAETSDPDIINALCDLFRVLGDKGLPLRRRMLVLAKPILSKIDQNRLKRLLEDGKEL
jgi:hypothetical protein